MGDGGEEDQTITPTDEHHDWIALVCGIDPRNYSAAPDEANSSGVVTLPEVTVIGSPAAPEEPCAGVITLPEVTVTGSPDPSSSDASPAAAPVVAAAAVPILTPGGPGPGVPFDPSIVDGQPWSPIQGGGSAATTGAEAAATGTEAAATGAEAAATGAEVVATGAEAGVVATETALGLAAAEGIGLGAVAAGVGAVAVGVVAVAAVGYGAYKVGEWLAEPSSDTSDPKVEDPGDPDNPNSGHGVAGAPEQTPSNPTAQPGGNYDPAQAPGADSNPAPMQDPSSAPQVSAPGAPVPAPMADPSALPQADAPGSDDSQDPAGLASGRSRRGTPDAEVGSIEGIVTTRSVG